MEMAVGLTLTLQRPRSGEEKLGFIMGLPTCCIPNRSPRRRIILPRGPRGVALDICAKTSELHLLLIPRRRA
jgi:hypothetical protein